ncbi:MAG: hypothetical protein ACLQVI_26930 [Polyangiaceae bacterium]|jgi:hypothetical protein
MGSGLRWTLAAAVPAVLVGCIFFTSGTNGYTTDDGGAPSSGCSSATDCDFDGGLVCCIATLGQPGSCQPAPCGIQLCLGSKECSAGSCIEQICDDAEVHACGHVSGCAKRSVDAASADDSGSPVGDDGGPTDEDGGLFEG